jgi:hypothetical protein
VKITEKTEQTAIVAKLKNYQKGVHNLFVIMKKGNPVEVDWIQFE